MTKTLKLKAKKLRLVKGSDELNNPGDCYGAIIQSVDQKGQESGKPVLAMVINCPFCGRPMASTGAHKITEHKAPWYMRLWTKEDVITVSNMLQCPYDRSHSFLIKNSRIKKIKKWQNWISRSRRAGSRF